MFRFLQFAGVSFCSQADGCRRGAGQGVQGSVPALIVVRDDVWVVTCACADDISSLWFPSNPGSLLFIITSSKSAAGSLHSVPRRCIPCVRLTCLPMRRLSRFWKKSHQILFYSWAILSDGKSGLSYVSCTFWAFQGANFALDCPSWVVLAEYLFLRRLKSFHLSQRVRLTPWCETSGVGVCS